MSKATIEDVERDAKFLTERFHTTKEGIVPLEVKSFEQIITSIRAIDTIEDITKLLQELHVKIDDRIGIKRYRAEDSIATLGATSSRKDTSIIRDATSQTIEQTFRKPEDAPEVAVLSILGTTRGALDIINKSEGGGKETLKRAVLLAAKKHIIELYKDEKITDYRKIVEGVKYAQTEIVSKLAEYKLNIHGASFSSEKALVKSLEDFRDACNIKYDEQNHLITITKGPLADTITTVAVKISPLSKKQSDELRQILRDDITESEKAGWYQDLNSYQKELVKDTANRILLGDAAIPTSLRFMPGTRNGYFTIALRTDDAASSTEIFERHIRTGTPAYYDGKKGPDLSVTIDNLEHIRDVSGKKISFQIFNNALQPGEESKIVKLVKAATRKLSISYSNVPHQLYFDKGQMIIDMLKEQTEPIDPLALQVIACKSGKDRTEFGERARILTAYEKKYGNGIVIDKKRPNTLNSEQKHKLSIFYSMAAHGAEIASINNHGSAGLKTDGAYAFATILKKLIEEKGLNHLYTWAIGQKSIDENKVAKFNKIALVEIKPKKSSKLDIPPAEHESEFSYVNPSVLNQSKSLLATIQKQFLPREVRNSFDSVSIKGSDSPSIVSTPIDPRNSSSKRKLDRFKSPPQIVRSLRNPYEKTH